MSIYELLILLKKNKLDKFVFEDLVRISKLSRLEVKPLFDQLYEKGFITSNEEREENGKRFFILEVSNTGKSYIKETRSQLRRTIRHDILSISAVVISLISLAISFFK